MTTHRRITDPLEAMAQRVAERVVDLVLHVVDLNALLAQVDVNALLSRIDMDALVEQTDLGAVIARSSGGVASEALDAARSQAVGLDQAIDRRVQRALRRKRPAPVAPRALLDGGDTPAEPRSDAPPAAQPDAPPAAQPDAPPAPEPDAPPAPPSEAPASEAVQ